MSRGNGDSRVQAGVQAHRRGCNAAKRDGKLPIRCCQPAYGRALALRMQHPHTDESVAAHTHVATRDGRACVPVHGAPVVAWHGASNT